MRGSAPPPGSLTYMHHSTPSDAWNLPGAAMMTGTKLVKTRVLGSAWPRHFNKVVAEATYENIKKVGLPEWSEADQTLAKAVQKELGVSPIELLLTLPVMVPSLSLNTEVL